MSSDIRWYADSAEISVDAEDEDGGPPWAENLVAAAITVLTVLCTSSVAVLMYLA